MKKILKEPKSEFNAEYVLDIKPEPKEKPA